jgi:hypothetical protein
MPLGVAGLGLALGVEAFWALALQAAPRQTAAAVMDASAIRNTDRRFFIFSIPPIWRVEYVSSL